MRQEPQPPSLAAFAHAALAEDTRDHLVVALYTTSSDEADSTSFSEAGARANPIAALFPEGPYRRFATASGEQLPRLAGASPVAPGHVDLAACRDRINLRGAWTSVFRLVNGACVGALWLRYALRGEADETRPLTELFADVDDGRHELRIGNATLVERFREDSGVTDLKLGLDFHAVRFLPSVAWTPDVVLDRQAAQSMVSRREQRSRADFLTIRLPAEANRYPESLAAITPGASLLTGQGAPASLAMIVAAVQALGSLATLRSIQARAFGQLRTLEHVGHGAAGSRLEEVATAARALRDLELELSFGVEALLEIRLLIPMLPVEQYHRELSRALALPEGSRVTASMVARLSGAIRAEATALEAERTKAAHALGNAAALLAAVTIPATLIFAFLGINASEVNSGASLGDSRYWLWYLALVAIPVACVAVAWRRGSRDSRNVR